MSYAAPVKDMKFVIIELAGLNTINQLPGCEDATEETVDAILEENAQQQTIRRSKSTFGLTA